MTISEQIPDSDATFLRRGEGDLAVVFVHGFLDDLHVWDKVIAELKTPGIETVRLDLAGLGDRRDAGGPFTYDGPVLVARGSQDGLVTEELVATSVSPRFASAQTVVIERAGHWPNDKQPAALAAHLDRFLTAHA